ncbi:MAG TPA: septal ring lytic transglycosylase RlpA family protein [Solirubrobacteraceae bacterium]|nr:septal ring lytic transglycosylase RlpA family protein [Solirubrobacteraceae bacterium]
MRPNVATRRWRRSRLGAGALIIAVPLSAAALVASQALAAPAQQALKITSRSVRIPYGHDVIVRGAAPSEAGHTVVLEFARRGASAWRRLSSTTIAGDGSFRLTGALAQSGMVRAFDTSTGSQTPLLARSSGGAVAQTSTPVPVEVSARIRVRPRPISVLGGQAILVRGRLLPGLTGRKVSLQGRENGRWQTLSSTRTRAAGRFVLRYVANVARQEQVRVKFAGDHVNGRSTASAGQMTVYREAGASWYDDGGNTACGFHAYYGVANRTLPCGTKVALRYNGRSVTATVDDRGPFVGGRDWDLNQNTASRLGFGGVGTVWSSQ